MLNKIIFFFFYEKKNHVTLGVGHDIGPIHEVSSVWLDNTTWLDWYNKVLDWTKFVSKWTLYVSFTGTKIMHTTKMHKNHEKSLIYEK